MADESDYSVGYKKPPRRTQFKKGQSGNPRGRPKGKRSWEERVQRAFEEEVSISVNGRSKRLTKFEVALMQVINKAAAGDLRALRECAALLRTFSPSRSDEDGQKPIPKVTFIIEE
jgi:hypothetical protein